MLLYTETSLSDCSLIASAIASAYRNGSRNEIMFALSGYLWHQNVSLEIAEGIVRELGKITDDEEIENRVEVVRRTYEKANAGKSITAGNKLTN